MALAFILIAVALIDVAYRNTFSALFTLLTADLPGFAKWALAIIVIGAMQYIPAFSTAAKYLLVLVLLAIVLANRGAFANFSAIVNGQPGSVQGGPTPTLSGNPTVNIASSGGSSAGVGGALGTLTSAVSAGAKLFGLF